MLMEKKYVIWICGYSDGFFWSNSGEFVDLLRDCGAEEDSLNLRMSMAHDLFDFCLKP